MDPTPHHPPPRLPHIVGAPTFLEIYRADLDRAGPEHRPEYRVISSAASVLDQLHRIVETRDPAYRIEKIDVLIRAGLELQLEVYEQLAPDVDDRALLEETSRQMENLLRHIRHVMLALATGSSPARPVIADLRTWLTNCSRWVDSIEAYGAAAPAADATTPSSGSAARVSTEAERVENARRHDEARRAAFPPPIPGAEGGDR